MTDLPTALPDHHMLHVQQLFVRYQQAVLSYVRWVMVRKNSDGSPLLPSP